MDPSPTEIYTLSLHDALPISDVLAGRLDTRASVTLRRDEAARGHLPVGGEAAGEPGLPFETEALDRKSTRLNSSHVRISYAVFCLKKKKKETSAYYYLPS